MFGLYYCLISGIFNNYLFELEFILFIGLGDFVELDLELNSYEFNF